jgi:ATP-dependent Lon protease
VAITAALVSLSGGRCHDVAMTGEITLRGRVLPIGGVKEKVLGAVRAGLTTVVLPKANEPDLEDLPAEIREKLTVHLVEELGEALAHTLRGGVYREGRLQFTTDQAASGPQPPIQH